jgi:spore maturation protein CgeB
MKFVIFGLSISSSWGNGHATLWRGLCAALAKLGHSVTFFERNTPYYQSTRDLFSLTRGSLILYENWEETAAIARRELSDADVGMVTSYCPDAIEATQLVLDSPVDLRCFYDLDTPITLIALERGERVPYIGERGLKDFDLTLSYAGGPALDKLQVLLGARAVAPLYGSVDSSVHHPVAKNAGYQADLSYLGTFAPDRQQRLEHLFVEPSRQLPERRFLIGGSMYDDRFPWQPNIHLLNHVPATDHPAFYCSALLNLSVSRQAMFENGYCPSGRLFEAAACGAPILTDDWPGLHSFFEPDSEILVAADTAGVVSALDRSPDDLARIASNARARTMEQHTAEVRARELETIMSTFRQTTAAGVQ